MTSFADSSIGLIYGSDTGNTQDVAEKIQESLSARGFNFDIIDVSEASAEHLQSLDLIIMGIPTWDFGGIQGDWEDFEPVLQTTDLSATTVALYGLGDQFGYGDYFLDAMGWLYELVTNAGARVIGRWSTEGYEFDASLAVSDDGKEFCGLGIDEDQQPELTDQRIEQWVEQIANEFQKKVAA